MTGDEDIRRYTVEQLDAMIARGESQTDWARIRAMTDEEVEANAVSDPDSHWPDIPKFDVSKANVSLPADDFVGLDRKILDFFRAQGPDFRDRIRAVLLDHIARAGRPAAAE